MAKFWREDEVESSVFTWDVHFPELVKSWYRRPILSPFYRFDNLTWNIKLFATQSDSGREYCHLECDCRIIKDEANLIHTNKNATLTRITFKFNVANGSGVILHASSTDKVITQSDNSLSVGVCIPGYATMSKMKKMAVDNSIHIQCRLRLSIKQELEELVRPHLEHLYEDRDFTDVTLVVGEKRFEAHRVILARSPVFAAMLRHDMKEKREAEVTITDLHEDAVEQMLTYLYTERITDPWQVNSDLLKAAAKYQIEDLLARCEDVLAVSLTPENSSERLISADMHELELLRNQVLNFMSENYDAVSKTKEFLHLMEARPDLAAEAYRSLGNSPPEKRRKMSLELGVYERLPQELIDTF